MNAAGAAAAAAAVCGLVGAWELLGTVERSAVARRAATLLAGLRRAGNAGADRSEQRRLVALLSLAALAAGTTLFGLASGLLALAATPFALRTAIGARDRRYASALDRDAPVLARALADAVAAGNAVRGAVPVAAAGELPGPAGARLRRSAAALERGASTEEALALLGGQAGSRLDTLAMALLLQRRAGGDLVHLLRAQAEALEASARAAAEARSVTTQARFTGLLVAALPLFAAGLAELASPGYLEGLLSSPLTAWLTGCALILQLVALWLLRRLARPA